MDAQDSPDPDAAVLLYPDTATLWELQGNQELVLHSTSSGQQGGVLMVTERALSAAELSELQAWASASSEASWRHVCCAEHGADADAGCVSCMDTCRAGRDRLDPGGPLSAIRAMRLRFFRRCEVDGSLVSDEVQSEILVVHTREVGKAAGTAAPGGQHKARGRHGHAPHGRARSHFVEQYLLLEYHRMFAVALGCCRPQPWPMCVLPSPAHHPSLPPLPAHPTTQSPASSCGASWAGGPEPSGVPAANVAHAIDGTDSHPAAGHGLSPPPVLKGSGRHPHYPATPAWDGRRTSNCTPSVAAGGCASCPLCDRWHERGKALISPFEPCHRPLRFLCVGVAAGAFPRFLRHALQSFVDGAGLAALQRVCTVCSSSESHAGLCAGACGATHKAMGTEPHTPPTQHHASESPVWRAASEERSAACRSAGVANTSSSPPTPPRVFIHNIDGVEPCAEVRRAAAGLFHLRVHAQDEEGMLRQHNNLLLHASLRAHTQHAAASMRAHAGQRSTRSASSGCAHRPLRSGRQAKARGVGDMPPAWGPHGCPNNHAAGHEEGLAVEWGSGQGRTGTCAHGVTPSGAGDRARAAFMPCDGDACRVRVLAAPSSLHSVNLQVHDDMGERFVARLAAQVRTDRASHAAAVPLREARNKAAAAAEATHGPSQGVVVGVCADMASQGHAAAGLDPVGGVTVASGAAHRGDALLGDATGGDRTVRNGGLFGPPRQLRSSRAWGDASRQQRSTHATGTGNAPGRDDSNTTRAGSGLGVPRTSEATGISSTAGHGGHDDQSADGLHYDAIFIDVDAKDDGGSDADKRWPLRAPPRSLADRSFLRDVATLLGGGWDGDVAGPSGRDGEARGGTPGYTGFLACAGCLLDTGGVRPVGDGEVRLDVLSARERVPPCEHALQTSLAVGSRQGAGGRGMVREGGSHGRHLRGGLCVINVLEKLPEELEAANNVLEVTATGHAAANSGGGEPSHGFVHGQEERAPRAATPSPPPAGRASDSAPLGDGTEPMNVCSASGVCTVAKEPPPSASGMGSRAPGGTPGTRDGDGTRGGHAADGDRQFCPVEAACMDVFAEVGVLLLDGVCNKLVVCSTVRGMLCESFPLPTPVSPVGVAASSNEHVDHVVGPMDACTSTHAPLVEGWSAAVGPGVGAGLLMPSWLPQPMWVYGTDRGTSCLGDNHAASMKQAEAVAGRHGSSPCFGDGRDANMETAGPGDEAFPQKNPCEYRENTRRCPSGHENGRGRPYEAQTRPSWSIMGLHVAFHRIK